MDLKCSLGLLWPGERHSFVVSFAIKREGNMEDEIKFNYHEIIVVYQLNDDC